MLARNISLALGSIVAGALIAALVLTQITPMRSAKSDRLGGPQTETAFMKERFGVPANTAQ